MLFRSWLLLDLFLASAHLRATSLVHRRQLWLLHARRVVRSCSGDDVVGVVSWRGEYLDRPVWHFGVLLGLSRVCWSRLFVKCPDRYMLRLCCFLLSLACLRCFLVSDAEHLLRHSSNPTFRRDRRQYASLLLRGSIALECLLWVLLVLRLCLCILHRFRSRFLAACVY